MAIDRVVIIIMALAVAMIVLMILSVGQFNNVLKTVLRAPEDKVDAKPVRLTSRLLVLGAVAAVIAALISSLVH
jgi:hypothetical protein